MRISDWSSDVCSSDLRHRAGTVSGTGPMAKGVRVALSAHVDVHLVDVSLWTGGGRQRHAVGRQAHVGEGAQHVLGIAPRAVGVERDAGGVAAGGSARDDIEGCVGGAPPSGAPPGTTGTPA